MFVPDNPFKPRVKFHSLPMGSFLSYEENEVLNTVAGLYSQHLIFLETNKCP